MKDQLLLDVSAGNRCMWGANKHPDNVVFLDIESGLRIPPDILASWRSLPFRADVFTCIIFDPPHTRVGLNSIHNDPKGIRARWWGMPITLKQIIRDVAKAQFELSKLSSTMCFKWNEDRFTLDRIMSCFTEWREIHRMQVTSKMKRGTPKTWFVRLRRRED